MILRAEEVTETRAEAWQVFHETLWLLSGEKRERGREPREPSEKKADAGGTVASIVL